MNFGIRNGASREEIDAVVERGLDAMFDAAEAGEDADVAFLFDGGEDGKSDDEEETTASSVADHVEEEIILCTGCEEDPCVFLDHRERIIAFDKSEHARRPDEELPSNNIRRKGIYRQLTLMLNGGPLGAGVRRELPTCCVSGIRNLLPSETFMGFMVE